MYCYNYLNYMKFEQSANRHRESMHDYEEIFDPLNAIEQAIEQGIYIHQIGEPQVDKIRSLIESLQYTYTPSSDGWNIKSSFGATEQITDEVWGLIAPDDESFEIVNDTANYFFPGGSIPKHLDFDDKVHYVSPANPLETAFTFVYVVSGSKDILFYKDGLDNPPRTITQLPGMLLVFPAGEIVDESRGLQLSGLWHEVPVQDASCFTYTWEIASKL